MKQLRTGILLCVRAILFVGITLFYLLLIWVQTWFGGTDWSFRMMIRRKWSRAICRAMGLQIATSGKIEESVYLLVGNHRCYFDPIIALQYADAFPVAMAEIAKWPLLGFAARVTGIIFVKRNELTSRRNTVQAIAQAFQEDISVMIYPEGTTNEHCEMLPFKIGSFKVAAELGIPVIPCMVDYPDQEMYWVDEDDSFISHVQRQFGKKRIHAHLSFGNAIRSDNADMLLQESRKWLQDQIEEKWKDWGRPCK